jgi:Zn-dependent peptidase ImmA (M78 family)
MALAQNVVQFLEDTFDTAFYTNGCYLDLQKVCKRLGLELYEADFDDDNICGAIVKEDGVWNIYVNDAHHPNRKRFTAAHEIGHYISMSLKSHSADKLANGEHEDCLYRKGEAINDAAEIEANQIAAEILMPRAMVVAMVQKNPYLTVEDLAAKFGVSSSSMTFRMKNLGWKLLEDCT